MRPLALALLVACTHPAPPPVTPTAPVVEQPAPPPPPPSWPAPTTAAAPGSLVFQRAHRRGVGTVSFTPDDRVLLSAGGDGVFAVVDVATGQLRASRRVFVRSGRRWVFATTPHEAIAASSGGFFDGTGGLFRWDLFADVWTPLYTSGAGRSATAHVDAARDGSAYVHRDHDEGGARLVLEREGHEPLALDVEAERVEHVAFDTSRDCTERPRCSHTLSVTLRDPSTVVLFDVRDGTRRAEAPGHHDTFVGNDAWLVANEREVTLRSRSDGSVRRTLTLDADPLVMLASPGVVAILEVGLGWRAFDTETLTPRGRWDESDAFALAADGSAAYRIADGALEEWPLGADAPRRSAHPSVSAYGMEVSNDGTTIALVAGADLVLWDVASWTERARVAGNAGEHSVWGARWSPDGTALVTYGRGGVERWGVEGAVSTPCRSASPPMLRAGGHGMVLAERQACDLDRGAFPSEGGVLLAAADDGTRALVWRQDGLFFVGDAGESPAGPPKPECRYGECLERVATDRTTNVVAVSSRRAVSVHTVGSRRAVRLAVPRGVDAAPRIRMAPDGSAVAMLVDAAVHVVDVRSRRVRFTLPAAEGAQVVFADDGSRVAVGHPESLRVVDARDGRVLVTASSVASFRDLRFSADGSRLIARGLEELVVVDLESGEERLRLRAFSPTSAVSDDGSRLARCDEGRLLVEDLVLSRRLDRGPCRPTDELVLSPDGTRLAQREDAIVRVHRLDGPLRGHGDVLVLRTYRTDDGVDVPVAEDLEGRFEVDPRYLPLFAWREAGGVVEGALRPASEGPRVEGLVARFFGR
ncbi:MAG: hypothetical protein H6721_29950 [Sandaracinus sp.]|nr:hypothetical protein [Sandaracinus sp.]